MRVVTLRTGLAVAIAAGFLGGFFPRSAGAQVSIVQEPERPFGLLYSAQSDQNCSDLSVLQGDSLPYHVVRLRAQVPAGADKIEWSLPKPQEGFLLADQDLGPQDTTAAVRGFCAEFGNSCLLTAKTLKFYNLPTILYAAPTCDVLPKDTKKPFGGGSVKIKVAAKAGKKKLGKAVTEVQYGSPDIASITLYTNYPIDNAGAREADDGGSDGVAQGYAITGFNAIETPADVPDLKPITSFEFNFGGRSSSAPTCPDDAAEPCVEIEATAPGTFFSTVNARLEDGSALCDAVDVQVGACPRKAQVQIIRVPSKGTYTSGDAARLRVRFANLSENKPGCGLILQGANVLTCSATFKIGETEDTKTDQWDLRHCSATTSQPCTTTADCECLSAANCECETCQPNEVCLTQSHCSETFTQLCESDSDCDEQQCPACKDNETCVHVLEVEELTVAPGEAVDIVDEVVTLKNEIGDPVSVKETWTANAFPQTSADASIKYKIKGE